MKEPKHWDLDYDVVVAGYGYAGGVSAICATDAGARTIILEKMAHFGGNSILSGGSVTVADLNHADFGVYAPIGTILRVSNSNTSTPGAKITSSGAHNVMALKIHGNKWTVLGPGT